VNVDRVCVVSVMASAANNVRSITKAASADARVLIVALGVTDGVELRPALELGGSLMKRGGIQVTVATHLRFKSLVKNCEGIRFVDAGLDPGMARRSTDAGKALEKVKSNPGLVGSALHAFVETLVSNWFGEGIRLLVGAEDCKGGSFDMVVLASPASYFVYASICDEYALATAVLDANPIVPTKNFPPPKAFRGVAAVRSEPTCEGQWAIYGQSLWRFLYRDAVNASRRHFLGLEPYTSPVGPMEAVSTYSSSAPLVLLGYSSALLPRPKEWPSHVHVVGPCVGGLGPLPEHDVTARTLPDAVREFFAKDMALPVVCCFFGPVGDHWADPPARNTLMLQCLEAFTLAKVRAIVVTPASTQLPGEYLVDGFRVLQLPALPVGSELVLYRKCALVVCSGDPWTLQASLLAGTPVLPVRFSGGHSAESQAHNNNEASAEAEFWGRASAAKGVGAPCAAADLSATSLGRLVRRLVNPDAPERKACREMAAAMQAAAEVPDNAKGGGKKGGQHVGLGKAVKLVSDLALPIAALRVAGVST